MVTHACVHACMHACPRLDARVCACMHGEHSPCAELASAPRACTSACTCVCAWMHACVSLEHPPWVKLTFWDKADWPRVELQCKAALTSMSPGTGSCSTVSWIQRRKNSRCDWTARTQTATRTPTNTPSQTASFCAASPPFSVALADALAGPSLRRTATRRLIPNPDKICQVAVTVDGGLRDRNLPLLSKASNVVQKLFFLYDVTGFTQICHPIPVATSYKKMKSAGDECIRMILNEFTSMLNEKARLAEFKSLSIPEFQPLRITLPKALKFNLCAFA